LRIGRFRRVKTRPPVAPKRAYEKGTKREKTEDSERKAAEEPCSTPGTFPLTDEGEYDEGAARDNRRADKDTRSIGWCVGSLALPARGRSLHLVTVTCET
jgi:hypothetical protein